MESEAASRLIREQPSQLYGSGYGVYSVVQRLKLTFNDDCQFQIHSAVGEETTISFNAPLKTEQQA